MAAQMGKATEPLLPSNEAAYEEEVQKKPKYLGKTKQEWIVFALKYRQLTVNAVVAFLCFLGLVFYEAEHLFVKLSLAVGVAVFGLLASVQGTYLVYISTRLDEEIENFRNKNEKMAETNMQFADENSKLEETNQQLMYQAGKLEETRNDMVATADKMSSEISAFEKFQDGLHKHGEEASEGFKENIHRVKQVFGDLHMATKDNERALILRAQQDLEFLDQEQGMNKEEFDKWVMRIPKRHRHKFADESFQFDQLKGPDGTIGFEKIKEVVDKLLAEVPEAK